jgi:hypothetical protein
MSAFKINSREHAEQLFDGVLEWEWGGKTSFVGLIAFAYNDSDSIIEENSNEDFDKIKNKIIKAYLLQNNEDPKFYF